MGKTPSPRYQANEILAYIDCRGTSRFEAKQKYYERCRESNTKANFSDLARCTGIYSHATADSYRDTWVTLLSYARSEFGVKFLGSLSPDHIKSFLESKQEEGLAKGTLVNICAAVTKLGTALDLKHENNTYYNDFKVATNDFLNSCNAQVLAHQNRAYANASELINAIKDPKMRLVAETVYRLGLRSSEATLIRSTQLNGNKLTITSKGGQKLEKNLTEDLKSKLEKHLGENNGIIKVNGRELRRAVQRAAEQTGQIPQGTHGLRYNYAQNLYVQLITEGKTPAEARQQVAEELGHHREDITNRYLS